MKKYLFAITAILCLISIGNPPFLKSTATEAKKHQIKQKDSIDYTELYKQCKSREENQIKELVTMASTPDTVIKYKIKIKMDTLVYNKIDTLILVKGLFGKLKPFEKEEVSIDSTSI